MTTLHLSASDIAALVVDDDGSVTIELTDEGLRGLEAVVARRLAKRAANVRITPHPGDVSRDGDFAAGVRVGYAYGRGPGMPPHRV